MHISRVNATVIAALASGIAATPATAHTVPPAATFAAGAAHPIAGVDHLAVAVAVGMLAALHGRRVVVTMPLAFMLFMSLGAALVRWGVPVTGVEVAIALSVVVVGASLLVRRAVRLLVLLAGTGTFAFFHGAAHGAEASNPVALAGIATSTAALHLLGICVVILAGRSKLPGLRHASGAAACVLGLLLLAGRL